MTQSIGMANNSEPISKETKPSLLEDLDPIKSLYLDYDPKARANVWAAVDIARKYLYIDSEGYYDSRGWDKLLQGLQWKVFPGLDNVQIKDILEKNGWQNPIITPNTNNDPNDKEDFKWYVTRWNGTVNRCLTEREEYAQSCHKAKEKEDPIEQYCYNIRKIIPWYDIAFDEKERLRGRRKEAASKRTELTEELQAYQHSEYNRHSLWNEET